MGPSFFFPGLPLNENTRRTIAQKIRALFAGSVEGAWYDPSDLSTMFTTASGAVPITATGQTVGLILDKRLALALGTPLTFSGAWTPNGAGLSGTDNVVTASAPAADRNAYLSIGLTAGIWYQVTYTISGLSAGNFYVDAGGASPNSTVRTANGTYTEIRYSTPNPNFYVVCGTGTTGVLTIDSVRHIAGNHAYQTTSGSRPTFRDVAGLRYLEFDGVDDYLRSTFTIAQPIDRISALQQVTWTNGEQLFGGVTGNAGVFYQTAATPSLYVYSGTNGPVLSTLAVATNGVATERHNGASSRLAINSGAYATGNANTNLPGGITIGASNTPNGWSNLLLHQLIMRGGPTALTDTQITLLRKVCYTAAGLPFPGYEETEVSRMFSSAPTAEGAWYDPSDMSTMWTTNSASVQVTATGQTVGWMLDKSKGLARTTKLASVNQFTFNAAGSTPPTTNSATTYLDKDCVSVTFPVLALGGYAVSRGAGNGGAAGWVPVVGEFCRISYEVVFSRPLVGAEQVVVYTTGSSAGAQITFSASVAPIAPTVWTTFSDLAYTDVIGGIGYPVVYAGSSAFDSGLTVYLRAYKVEKVSGNHAYQTTAASRPVFRDVGGLRYLEFDGVDDFLRATFTIAQPIDRISAIRQVTWTSGDQLYGSVTANDFAILQQTGGASPRLYIYAGGFVGPVTPELALSTSGVITERFSGAASRMVVNANSYTTGDAGSGVPGGITIGADFGGSSPANFHLHQLIMRGSTTAMTDAQIAACRALSAVKSGVTL